MKKGQKLKIVENLKEKLGKAKSIVLADYRGLTHQQMEEIKKALRQAQGELVVTKNTLLKLALPSSIIHDLSSSLTGPTATLFSYQDELVPLSVLAKFIKNFGLPKIKMGIVSDKILSSEEILKLATLPSREILMTQLTMTLKAPISRAHYALSWNIQKLLLVLSAKVKVEAKNG